MFIIGLAVGGLIMAQWKTKPVRVLNPVAPYAALRDTRDNLTVEQTGLKQEITLLRKDIKLTQSQLKRDNQESQQLEELERLKEVIGLTELKGQGVQIILDDSRDLNAQGTAEAAIAHAADMRDLVNYLWTRGAKAISINNERITSSSSIDCIINTVMINNTKHTTPFVFNVLGDPRQLQEALQDKNALINIYNRVRREGLVFNFSRQKDLTVPAYAGSFPTDNMKVRGQL